MSWKDKMKEWGGAQVTFLSEDGEVCVCLIVAEPILLEGKFKGNVSERIGAPVITSEGFSILVLGKRTARRLSKYEDKFKDTAVMIVRHGESGDINAHYDVSLYEDAETTTQLLDIKKRDFKAGMIPEAVKEVLDIMAG